MAEPFLKGVVGGIMAGIIKDIPDVILHRVFKITSITFWDYAGIVALKRHPQGVVELLFAFSYEIVFSILIGIIFVYLTTSIKTKYRLLTGGVYGALVWFIVHAVILCFQIKELMIQDTLTLIVNSLGSVFYGVILVYIIERLGRKEPSKA